mmetsp:Transcript_8471/g.19383  ORF Transcript_8471/g.19383 Transcript_8471/m.19383 type:complete len:215 (+) Transcript_8471:1399-2043(+)
MAGVERAAIMRTIVPCDDMWSAARFNWSASASRMTLSWSRSNSVSSCRSTWQSSVASSKNIDLRPSPRIIAFLNGFTPTSMCELRMSRMPAWTSLASINALRPASMIATVVLTATADSYALGRCTSDDSSVPRYCRHDRDTPISSISRASIGPVLSIKTEVSPPTSEKSPLRSPARSERASAVSPARTIVWSDTPEAPSVSLRIPSSAVEIAPA